MPNPSDPMAPRTIDREVFAHLVGLAALELTEEEAEYLRQELNHQLSAIRELETIHVEAETPITSHGVPYTEAISPVLREDEVRPGSEAEAILQQAPEVDERYIVVPDIPHTELR